MSLGIVLRIAVSVALDNWAFVGIGMAIGLSVGVTLEESSKKQGA